VKIDLAAMVRRKGRTRKTRIPIRAILQTNAQQQDLASIYRRVVTAWSARIRERILPSYTEALASIRDSIAVRDDINDLRRNVDGLAAEMDRLVAELTPSIQNWAVRVERWHRDKWTNNVASPTGVDLSFVLGPEDMRETLAAVVARNVGLVRSVNDETRARIADIVFRGFTARRNAVDVGRELSDALDMSRRRANNIAKDQTVKLARTLDQERRRQAGITTWIWRHSGKVHFRPEHKERDGNVYSDNDPPEDMPGELPNCGCTSEAVLVLD
jgi:SPP1 gp7 family putative phage head morphogenesis protein